MDTTGLISNSTVGIASTPAAPCTETTGIIGTSNDIIVGIAKAMAKEVMPTETVGVQCAMPMGIIATSNDITVGIASTPAAPCTETMGIIGTSNDIIVGIARTMATGVMPTDTIGVQCAMLMGIIGTSNNITAGTANTWAEATNIMDVTGLVSGSNTGIASTRVRTMLIDIAGQQIPGAGTIGVKKALFREPGKGDRVRPAGVGGTEPATREMTLRPAGWMPMVEA